MGVVELDIHHAGPEAASGWLTSRCSGSCSGASQDVANNISPKGGPCGRPGDN